MIGRAADWLLADWLPGVVLCGVPRGEACLPADGLAGPDSPPAARARRILGPVEVRTARP